MTKRTGSEANLDIEGKQADDDGKEALTAKRNCRRQTTTLDQYYKSAAIEIKTRMGLVHYDTLLNAISDPKVDPVCIQRHINNLKDDSYFYGYRPSHRIQEHVLARIISWRPAPVAPIHAPFEQSMNKPMQTLMIELFNLVATHWYLGAIWNYPHLCYPIIRFYLSHAPKPDYLSEAMWTHFGRRSLSTQSPTQTPGFTNPVSSSLLADAVSFGNAAWVHLICRTCRQDFENGYKTWPDDQTMNIAMRTITLCVYFACRTSQLEILEDLLTTFGTYLYDVITEPYVVENQKWRHGEYDLGLTTDYGVASRPVETILLANVPTADTTQKASLIHILKAYSDIYQLRQKLTCTKIASAGLGMNLDLCIIICDYLSLEISFETAPASTISTTTTK